MDSSSCKELTLYNQPLLIPGLFYICVVSGRMFSRRTATLMTLSTCSSQSLKPSLISFVNSAVFVVFSSNQYQSSSTWLFFHFLIAALSLRRELCNLRTWERNECLYGSIVRRGLPISRSMVLGTLPQSFSPWRIIAFSWKRFYPGGGSNGLCRLFHFFQRTHSFTNRGRACHRSVIRRKRWKQFIAVSMMDSCSRIYSRLCRNVCSCSAHMPSSRTAAFLFLLRFLHVFA